MSAVTRMLYQADEAARSASGAVRAALVDLRKEVAYLAGELNVGGSADARERVIAAADARIGKLRKRLDKILDYQAAEAQGFAEKGAKDAGFTVKLSERRAKAVLDSVQRAGGEGMAATLTRSMEASVSNALRNAVVAAFNENAIAGGTARDLSKIIRSKWEAALKNPEATAFVDRAGRTWDLDNYLMMNVRTNSMRVFNETIQAEAVAGGDDLVRVTSGGDPDCGDCFPWEGRILSVTGKTKGLPTVDEAEAAGLFHPNCTHHLLPVDAEFVADEIELQKQFMPEVDANGEITPDAADQARYDMDIARKVRDQGVTAEEGRALVDRDNLENAIRQGLIKTEAESRAVVDGLTDAQVNALCGGNGNPPEFSPAKDNGGRETWHHGKRGGVLYVDPKKLDTGHLVDVGDVGQGRPYGPYKLKYTPPKRTEEPKKTAQEIAAEEIAAIEADLNRFWAREYEMEAAFTAFQDKELMAAGDRLNVISHVFLDTAAAAQRDAAWARNNVPQVKRLEDIAIKIGEIPYAIGNRIEAFGRAGNAAQELLDAGRGSGPEAEAARRNAAKAVKDALELLEKGGKRLEAWKAEVARLLAEADGLEAEGRAVIAALVEREKADAKVTRTTPDDIGLTAERIAELHETPLEAALKATTKLTDNVDKLQKTVDARIAELNAEKLRKYAEVAARFKPDFDRLRDVRNAMSAGGYDTPYSVKLAAGLGAIESIPGMRKKWDTYVKTQTTRGNMDFRTVDWRGNPLTPEETARRHFRAFTKFVNNRVDEVSRKEGDARHVVYVETQKALAQVNIVNALAARNPSTVRDGEVAPSRKEIWEATKPLIGAFVDKSVLPDVPVQVNATSRRAFQSGGSINLTAGNGVGTYAHEYAHFIEDHNPHVHARCQEFLLMRAERSGTTTPESLRKLTGIGYEEWEQSLKDDFFNPYCGKVYGSQTIAETTGKHGSIRRYEVSATEVLSMGIQEIIEHPADFWKRDREYFTFVTNVLQGVL